MDSSPSKGGLKNSHIFLTKLQQHLDTYLGRSQFFILKICLVWLFCLIMTLCLSPKQKICKYSSSFGLTHRTYTCCPLLTRSLHRSHLNKGCYGMLHNPLKCNFVNFEIPIGFLYYENPFGISKLTRLHFKGVYNNTTYRNILYSSEMLYICSVRVRSR